MTWRQLRPATITAGAVLIAVAATRTVTRPTLLSLYASAGMPGCYAACASDARSFLFSVE